MSKPSLAKGDPVQQVFTVPGSFPAVTRTRTGVVLKIEKTTAIVLFDPPRGSNKAQRERVLLNKLALVPGAVGAEPKAVVVEEKRVRPRLAAVPSPTVALITPEELMGRTTPPEHTLQEFEMEKVGSIQQEMNALKEMAQALVGRCQHAVEEARSHVEDISEELKQAKHDLVVAENNLKMAQAMGGVSG